MSIRAFVIGIVLILGFGAIGALLLRSEDDDDATADVQRGAYLADTVAGLRAPGPDADTTRTNPMAEIGTVAPAFELERLDGGSFSLEDHRGHVVLLNFWATWCAPCRDEMPDLQQLWEAYRDDELQVVGISLDEEGRSIVEEFHATFPVEYPLLLNGSAVAAEYGADYFVPTSFVIGRDGRILDRHIGVITMDEFEERVQAVL